MSQADPYPDLDPPQHSRVSYKSYNSDPKMLYTVWYWAFHILPQICTAPADALVPCLLKQMQYRFEVNFGTPSSSNLLYYWILVLSWVIIQCNQSKMSCRVTWFLKIRVGWILQIHKIQSSFLLILVLSWAIIHCSEKKMSNTREKSFSNWVVFQV